MSNASGKGLASLHVWCMSAARLQLPFKTFIALRESVLFEAISVSSQANLGQTKRGHVSKIANADPIPVLVADAHI